MTAQPKDPVPRSPRGGVPGRSGSTLARGLAVLAAVAERGEIRAGELAAAADLPVSTVYRYLRLLREHGFVIERDGIYGRGPRLSPGDAASAGYAGLARTATPVMERLTQLTGETVTRAVRVGASPALCVHQTDSPNAEHTGFRIGQTLPLHAGAGERVLLAFAPREVIQLALVGELEQFTDNTPQRDELVRKIASTRSSWITTSRAEYVPGALAVAVPVAVDGEVMCSLTVSGPNARCDAGWQARVKPVLLNAGRALEHLLRESAWLAGLWPDGQPAGRIPA
ncbi:MAG: IclR family transcriptional regulator [Solirubrobacteraceae bacterium]